MSEVRIPGESLFVGKAYLVGSPKAEFASKLERFYNPLAQKRLGKTGLRLTQTEYLQIYDNPRAELSDYDRVVSAAEISKMESALRRHPHNAIVDQNVLLRKYYPSPWDEPGIDMEFKLHLHPLTAIALSSVWLKGDTTVVNLHIARKDMALGPTLLEARADLSKSLESSTRLAVENLHISTPDVLL